MATIFYTGCTLDGFLADPQHDLSWLLTRDIDPATTMGFEAFRPRSTGSGSSPPTTSRAYAACTPPRSRRREAATSG